MRQGALIQHPPSLGPPGRRQGGQDRGGEQEDAEGRQDPREDGESEHL